MNGVVNVTYTSRSFKQSSTPHSRELLAFSFDFRSPKTKDQLPTSAQPPCFFFKYGLFRLAFICLKFSYGNEILNESYSLNGDLQTLCVLTTHHLFAPLRAKKGYMLKVKS